jgi:hypothetical protein
MTAERRCEECGAPLPALARSNRRYCRSACRTAASQRRRREAEISDIRPKSELEQAIERATEEPKLLASVVAAAARGDWRASAWVLSRRWPDRWGPPPQRQVEQVPRVLDHATGPFAEVDELAARRRRT